MTNTLTHSRHSDGRCQRDLPAFTKPSSRRRGRQAQTTVEFSLILWPFLLLLLATTDYAQLYFYESSMRHALREAGRFATPGNVFYQKDSNGDFILDGSSNKIPENSSYGGGPMSRNEAIRQTFLDVCLIKALKDEDVKITSWPGTNGATKTESNPNDGPGFAEHLIKISVAYPIQLITPVATLLEEDATYVITVSSIFRNEPSRNFGIFTNKYSSEPTSL